MGLKQSIVIKSQFGSKTPGRYIKEYTSREDATETLEIENYISQYTPRMNATEKLKQNISSEIDVEAQEEGFTSKQGVMFGNHGLSYSDKMLKSCAKKIQKATDEGHVPILQVISFEHNYLKEKGIISEGMQAPKQDGDYKGQVDQLKLRQGITDMMNRMHRDMGFNEPEWGASIHLDTKHVHVHITTVDTGQPKAKRLKKIKEKLPERQPRMKWRTNDKTSYYNIRMNNDGFIRFERDGNIIAEQEETKQGNPKWYKSEEDTGRYVEVERGKINDKVKEGMRDHLNRSLSKTKDIKPFVKEVGDKKRLTKALTLDTIYYNDVTVEKLKTLIAALPENQKMWRAKSNAKAMQRPHEIANDIIEDIWMKNKDAINLDDFDQATKMYAETRQHDEEFDDKTKNEQIATAYNQLKEESINMLYKDIKQRVNDEDKHVDAPKYSIKSTNTETLKNEIVLGVRDKSNKQPSHLDRLVKFEYKQRSYDQRLKQSHYEKNKYKEELDRYDYLKKNDKTSQSSEVVRNFYQQEFDYHNNIYDKYSYLKYGKVSGVSKDRFEEVKGTDLINMLYDYGKGDDRSVPRNIAEKYVEQTDTRKQAINQTLNYLVETNQIEQYEILRQHRDSIRKEADIAYQINEELSMPIPQMNSESTIEKRKTIDTIQGRRLLKQELRELEKINRSVTEEYQLDKENKRYTPKKNTYQYQDNDYNNLADYRQNIQQQWAIEKLKYSQFYLGGQQKEYEDNVLEQVNINKDRTQSYDIEL